MDIDELTSTINSSVAGTTSPSTDQPAQAPSVSSSASSSVRGRDPPSKSEPLDVPPVPPVAEDDEEDDELPPVPVLLLLLLVALLPLVSVPLPELVFVVALDLSGSVFLGGSDSAWCSIANETNQAGIANAAAKPGTLIATK
jgi:hypothetical protein